ncbi:transposase [Companilactobacillus sp. RD055328]|uniref:transposase n=1 Tax=Companilactobacillus sp. RD055328 TaxID=2916634 RepID=UPI001FC7C4BD|nr:transposase [Companilactobacillus sp. RD055328]GKQ43015.1 transposase [Companilactobacillus sp. RD055328]
MTNNQYSYETKLEAIRLLNTGMSGRKICEHLGLKSDGLIYTWRNWLRNNEYYRLNQPAGKQYKYHKGIKDLPQSKQSELQITQMKEELEVVKKYLIAERLW